MLVDAPSIHFVYIDPFLMSKLQLKKLSGLASVSQWNCLAISPQNAGGLSTDCWYNSWYWSMFDTYAFLLISSDGANKFECEDIFRARLCYLRGFFFYLIPVSVCVCVCVPVCELAFLSKFHFFVAVDDRYAF